MKQVIRNLMALSVFFTAGQMAVAQEKARVIAVNYPLQYFAERLLADQADVIYPVPKGTDPSFWRPSIADISAVQSADLILLNGAGFAGWTAKVSLPRSRTALTTRGLEDRFITTKSITHSHGDGGAHSHEGKAAYVWLDPSLALGQAKAVAKGIKKRKLADAALVDERMQALATDLTALDGYARQALNAGKDMVLIATHPRYQYLARAYGLTILSLEWEAGAMPDEQQLADLQALAGKSGAAVLLWEAEPPAAARKAVAALGLKDVVFPSLAVPPADGDLIGHYQMAVQALGRSMK